MTLTSLKFIIAFFILYLVILIVNKCFKNKFNIIFKHLILITSFLFVLAIDVRFLLIMILFIIANYFIAKKNKSYRCLTIGIVVNILFLSVFKYFNFFVNSFGNIFNLNVRLLNILLPVGISFYTFSAISYLVDLKSGKCKKQNLLDYSLYISFFPKIISGPIVRPNNFFHQLEKIDGISYENFEIGIQLFVYGLFKKIVIADHLCIFVDDIFNYTNFFSGFTVILGIIAYSLQIYFDFSGYSEMAIGISKILGFNFDNNFNLPYISKSPTEFWKRWHISLSSWLQDYLYIPLGGNRKGKVRTYINLMITMILGGLWHGANITFVIWGLINGFGLIVHKLYKTVTKESFKNVMSSFIYNIISVLLTFIFVSFGWIFFRASSISNAFNIIIKLFNNSSGINFIYSWLYLAIFVCILEYIVSLIKNGGKNIYYPHLKFNNILHLTLFFVFCGITIIMAYFGETQFIYGNF